MNDLVEDIMGIFILLGLCVLLCLGAIHKGRLQQEREQVTITIALYVQQPDDHIQIGYTEII